MEEANSSKMESVRVVVRCRPFSKKEIEAGYKCVSTIDKSIKAITLANPKGSSKDTSDEVKTYTFDTVFDQDATQAQVYEETVRPIVDSVLNGFNGTVFAYGQTGTGKTFTMQGIKEQPELRGVIPNAFSHIFSHISQTANRKFLVSVSYLEIYNEEIRDLLSQEKGGKKGLELKEHPDRGIYVKDLSTYVVKSVEEMERLTYVGNANRSVGATLMNEQSSRSHSIFTVNIESCCTEGAQEQGETNEHIVAGKLHLVDLAGSERQSKTGASGDRLKEAAKINLSLTALGNCISALVDSKTSHIPYRDSKLTRLLQDSLGGNAKTLMIATASPADYNYDETLSTLRYANRAKNIKNKPRINEDPKDALLREYQEEIQRLRALVAQKQGGGGSVALINSSKLNSRQKKARKHTASNGSRLDVMVDEPPEDDSQEFSTNLVSTEDRLEEERIKKMLTEIEDERKELEQSTTLKAEEKLRIEADLNERMARLEQERSERERLSERLKIMETKLIVGGVSIHQHVEFQQKELEEQQRKLAEQRDRQQQLLKQLEDKQEAQFQLEGTYASLQEEVDIKTKKLNKLWSKLQAVKDEIALMQDDFRKEREELLDTIRDLSKEILLKNEVIEHFIPVEEKAKIEERLEFNEEEEQWVIKNTLNDECMRQLKRPLASPNVFKRPVSLLARYKMATIDTNIRYRPENLMVVQLEVPPDTTKSYNLLLDSRSFTSLDDPLAAAFQMSDSRGSVALRAKTATRPPTGRKPSAGIESSFPVARGMIAEKKRFA